MKQQTNILVHKHFVAWACGRRHPSAGTMVINTGVSEGQEVPVSSYMTPVMLLIVKSVKNLFGDREKKEKNMCKREQLHCHLTSYC